MEEELLKPFNIDIISFTNKGLRQSNEDRSYHYRISDNSYLLLIADGMGGYTDGHLAAEIAVEVISRHILSNCIVSPEKEIEFAFFQAHQSIKEKLNNAGATCGGILFTPLGIYLFWTGDIKIIMINDEQHFFSKEHTLLNALRDANITIKPDEIKRLTNTVVRSLGGGSNSYIPEIIKLERHTSFKGLVCSDGMMSNYSNEEILDLISKNNYSSLRALFDPSVFNDSKDNVTGLFFFSS